MTRGQQPKPARPLEWKAQAACRAFPDVNFFPHPHEDHTPAQEVCFDCPVQAACLDYAIKNNEQYGVWGGASARQRRRMQRTGRTVLPRPKPKQQRPSTATKRLPYPVVDPGPRPLCRCGCGNYVIGQQHGVWSLWLPGHAMRVPVR